MDLDSPITNSNPEIVDSRRFDLASQTPHMRSLGRSDRIDRIASGGDGADLDSHPDLSIAHEKVDLTAVHLKISIQEGESLLAQPRDREPLTDLAEHRPSSTQSLSSVFSSFSTFTSRKVRT